MLYRTALILEYIWGIPRCPYHTPASTTCVWCTRPTASSYYPSLGRLFKSSLRYLYLSFGIALQTSSSEVFLKISRIMDSPHFEKPLREETQDSGFAEIDFSSRPLVAPSSLDLTNALSYKYKLCSKMGTYSDIWEVTLETSTGAAVSSTLFIESITWG